MVCCAEIEHEGVVTPAASHTLHVAAGHQGVVGRAALDVVASRGADDELRGVRVFRFDIAGVPVGGEEGVGLHHVGVGVALHDVR